MAFDIAVTAFLISAILKRQLNCKYINREEDKEEVGSDAPSGHSQRI